MAIAQAGGGEGGVLRGRVQVAEQAAGDVRAVRGVGVPVLVPQTELVRQLVHQLHGGRIGPPRVLVHRPVPTHQVHGQVRRIGRVDVLHRHVQTVPAGQTVTRIVQQLLHAQAELFAYTRALLLRAAQRDADGQVGDRLAGMREPPRVEARPHHEPGAGVTRASRQRQDLPVHVLFGLLVAGGLVREAGAGLVRRHGPLDAVAVVVPRHAGGEPGEVPQHTEHALVSGQQGTKVTVRRQTGGQLRLVGVVSPRRVARLRGRPSPVVVGDRDRRHVHQIRVEQVRDVPGTGPSSRSAACCASTRAISTTTSR
ncbi:hypothetical protein L1856_34580 [Streptomyces sp. Tue 6430]|nr:hypothetical protein [Streptomyces sp. Tue 6430]